MELARVIPVSGNAEGKGGGDVEVPDEIARQEKYTIKGQVSWCSLND